MLIFTTRIANWLEDGLQLSVVREVVFINEQQVPVELEWDEFDIDCVHALAVDSDGKPIGTARCLPNGHIGRMAVLKEWRGKGVGRALLYRLIEEIRNQHTQQATLNAQTYAIEFYRKFGFQVVGKEFMDAGIPHVQMVLRL